MKNFLICKTKKYVVTRLIVFNEKTHENSWNISKQLHYNHSLCVLVKKTFSVKRLRKELYVHNKIAVGWSFLVVDKHDQSLDLMFIICNSNQTFTTLPSLRSQSLHPLKTMTPFTFISPFFISIYFLLLV